jgi:AbrB family looped-hinge helix DNA binding protein
MAMARITSKGQVVIPKAVREKLRLKTGDSVDFIIQEGGEIVVRPADHHVRELRGVLYRKGQSPVSLEEMKHITRHRSRRIGRRACR